MRMILGIKNIQHSTPNIQLPMVESEDEDDCYVATGFGTIGRGREMMSHSWRNCSGW
jgi:hypothetical protein